MFIFLQLDNELEFFHSVKLVITLITSNYLINNNTGGNKGETFKRAACQAWTVFKFRQGYLELSLALLQHKATQLMLIGISIDT